MKEWQQARLQAMLKELEANHYTFERQNGRTPPFRILSLNAQWYRDFYASWRWCKRNRTIAALRALLGENARRLRTYRDRLLETIEEWSPDYAGPRS